MNIIERLSVLAAPNQDDPSIKPSNVTVSDVKVLFKSSIDIIALVAGIIAFFYLVYSGILYLTAAGNPDAAKKGQQGLINAIIGIVIIVAAWAIITAVTGEAEDLVNPNGF